MDLTDTKKILLFIPLLLMGCGSASINEGRRTIAVADSLETKGCVCDDSCRIVEAINIFHPYRFSLSKEYALAQYYYGNLLYDRNNLEEAKKAYVQALQYSHRNKSISEKVCSRLSMCSNVPIHHERHNYWQTILLVLFGIGLLIMLIYEYAQFKYKKQIVSYYRHLVQESVVIKAQTEQLLLRQQENRSLRMQQLESNLSAIQHSKDILRTIYWSENEKMKEFFNQNFFQIDAKLCARQQLNEKERSLCLLVFIGSFSDKQLADILFYSDKSIRAVKRKVANKLGTTSAKLRLFLINLALQ